METEWENNAQEETGRGGAQDREQREKGVGGEGSEGTKGGDRGCWCSLEFCFFFKMKT